MGARPAPPASLLTPALPSRTLHCPAPQKYVPIDLRAKKTRAIRRRLTKAQAGAKTEKAAKKARAFPLRK